LGDRHDPDSDRGFTETDGQPDGDGRTLADLAFQVNGAPVFVDDLTHKDHAQTGSTNLSGKIGFKDSGQYLRGHPSARILEHQACVAHIHRSGNVNLPLGGVASKALRTRWATATLKRCLFTWA